MSSAYCDYSALYIHVPGKQQANINTFIPLLLPTTPANVPELGNTILLFECLRVDPLSAAQLKTYTNHDPVLSKVRNYMYMQ